MEEQPLDMRATLRAVRRHRLLVAVLVVVGLGAAVAYGVKTRPLPGARSLVLLPPNAITGNPGVSPYTKTQEIIVASSRVLAGAAKAVYPPVDPSSLKDHLTVTAPSQDVLSISVRAASSADAERLADGVAASYISYVDGVGSATEQLLSQLHQQAGTLTKKIVGLQRKINTVQSRLAGEKTGSPAAQRDSSLLSSLSTQQQQLSIQLNSINAQVTSTELGTAQSASATQLLQSAEPLGVSGARLPLIALLGALAGLVAGCVLAVALTRGDRPLRSRNAIATSIGVPVVASMWAKRCKKVRDWQALLEGAKSFPPMEIWNARRLFHRLVTAGGAAGVEVQLLAFSGDEAATAAGVKMGQAAAALGMSSQFEVADQPALAPLRAAYAVSYGASDGSATQSAMAGPRVASTASTELSGRAATLKLSVIEPGKAEVRAVSGTVLLVVSSGFATSAELAHAALVASDAGSHLTGVIVANPDPDDHTSGLLAEPSEPLGPKAPSLNGHVAPEPVGEEPK